MNRRRKLRAASGNRRQERSELDGRQSERDIDPLFDGAVELDAALRHEHRNLPYTDRGHERLFGLIDGAPCVRTELARIARTPDPCGRVEHDHEAASQSSG